VEKPTTAKLDVDTTVLNGQIPTGKRRSESTSLEPTSPPKKKLVPTPTEKIEQTQEKTTGEGNEKGKRVVGGEVVGRGVRGVWDGRENPRTVRKEKTEKTNVGGKYVTMEGT